MKYKTKPVIKEAFKWTGDADQIEDPEWITEALKKGQAYIINSGTKKVKLMIKTLEGLMMTRPGDYIVKGLKGELYPCKSDIFEESYEKVE